jgi:hypothetical protein
MDPVLTVAALAMMQIGRTPFARSAAIARSSAAISMRKASSTGTRVSDEAPSPSTVIALSTELWVSLEQ